MLQLIERVQRDNKEHGVVILENLDSLKRPNGSLGCVVSICGPQQIGKSTLSDRLFGTDFKVPSQAATPARCTTGAQASRTSPIFKEGGVLQYTIRDPEGRVDRIECVSPIVLDLEGSGGSEQASSGSISLERQLLLLALLVSDVVIINSYYKGLSLADGGIWDSLMVAIKARLMWEAHGSDNFRQRPKLIFALRDVPLEELQRNSTFAKDYAEPFKRCLNGRYQKILHILKLHDGKRELCNDFQIHQVALPYLMSPSPSLYSAVVELRKSLTKTENTFSSGQSKRPVLRAVGIKHMGSLNDLERIWARIQDIKDLEATTPERMESLIRCQRILDNLEEQAMEKLGSLRECSSRQEGFRRLLQQKRAAIVEVAKQHFEGQSEQEQSRFQQKLLGRVDKLLAEASDNQKRIINDFAGRHARQALQTWHLKGDFQMELNRIVEDHVNVAGEQYNESTLGSQQDMAMWRNDLRQALRVANNRDAVVCEGEVSCRDSMMRAAATLCSKAILGPLKDGSACAPEAWENIRQELRQQEAVKSFIILLEKVEDLREHREARLRAAARGARTVMRQMLEDLLSPPGALHALMEKRFRMHYSSLGSSGMPTHHRRSCALARCLHELLQLAVVQLHYGQEAEVLARVYRPFTFVTGLASFDELVAKFMQTIFMAVLKMTAHGYDWDYESTLPTHWSEPVTNEDAVLSPQAVMEEWRRLNVTAKEAAQMVNQAEAADFKRKHALVRLWGGLTARGAAVTQAIPWLGQRLRRRYTGLASSYSKGKV